MLCATCGKDSTNRRVCPYCFTPYPPSEEPISGPSRRKSTSTTAQAEGAWPGTPRGPAPEQAGFVRRQSPIVQWSGLGIIVLLLVWALTRGDAPAPSGSAGTRVEAPADEMPMSREEALAHIRETRERSLVETQADEVFVTFSGATFPVQEAGQLALVRRFVRADEVAEGRRRRIFFYGPNGKKFAQSDAVTGLTIVR